MTEPENDDTVPEEPDLGASIQLESGETLDGQPGTDAMDALYVAPNRPFGLDDTDTTPAGQRRGDTLDERLAREIPDDVGGAATGPSPEQTEGEIGSEAGQGRAGRLTADVVAADSRSTDVLDADDAGLSGGVASAEEAAVHVIDEDEITPTGELSDDLGGVDDVLEDSPEVRLRGDDTDPASRGNNPT
jgi:hypothetical protein